MNHASAFFVVALTRLIDRLLRVDKIKSGDLPVAQRDVIEAGANEIFRRDLSASSLRLASTRDKPVRLVDDTVEPPMRPLSSQMNLYLGT